MIKHKLLQMWRNKYGNDQLGMFIYVLWLILLLVNVFARSIVITYLELLCMVIYLYRFISSHHQQRYSENMKFLEIKDKISSKFTNKKSTSFYTTEVSYKYYKCKGCGAKLRVPKGKGKISITCPKCKTTFKSRS